MNVLDKVNRANELLLEVAEDEDADLSDYTRHSLRGTAALLDHTATRVRKETKYDAEGNTAATSDK